MSARMTLIGRACASQTWNAKRQPANWETRWPRGSSAQTVPGWPGRGAIAASGSSAGIAGTPAGKHARGIAPAGLSACRIANCRSPLVLGCQRPELTMVPRAHHPQQQWQPGLPEAAGGSIGYFVWR